LKTALVTLKMKLQMLNMLGIIKHFTSLNVKRTSDTRRQIRYRLVCPWCL